MTLVRFLPVLLFTCVTLVPQTSPPSAASAVAVSTAKNINLLLQGEVDALKRFEEQIAPSIRCDYYDGDMRQNCRDFLQKIQDESKQARKDIARYQSSRSSQAAVLFDAYVDLRSVLEDITILAIEDQSNGNHNREPLATAYNSFVKLTGVWFTGEMRERLVPLGR